MTTSTFLPPVAPPSPPENPDGDAGMQPVLPPELLDYRRRYRRRLFLWSLPVVLVVVLVALKLLSLPLFAAASQATYDAKSYDRSVAAADGLAPVNVLEPWVHHFDRGAALARIGVLVDARGELQQALGLVPTSDANSSCRVRTDLVLVVEQQGDSAVLDQQYSQAEGLYKQALALIANAPDGCFTKPNDPQSPPSSKKPLQDAQGRLQQKQQQAQQNAGGGQGGQVQGGQGQNGQGQGGQGQNGQGQGGQSQDPQTGGQGGGSSDPLDKLKEKDGQAQQEQQQNNDRNRYFKQNPEDYGGKPW